MVSIKKELSDSKAEYKVMLVIAILLALMFVVFYSHSDIEHIAFWGIGFDRCLFTGKLSGYVQYLIDNDQRSNYNFLFSVVSGIIVLPVYIVERIGGAEADPVYYCTWYKVIILVINLLNAGLMTKIFEKLKVSSDRAKYMGLIYFTSWAALFTGIGMGQVDNMPLFFMLLAIYYYLDGKEIKAAFALSAMIPFKGLSLIFIVPMFIYIYGNDIKKMFKLGCVALSIPVVEKVIQNVLVPGYGQMQSEFEDAWNHLEYFFMHQLGEVPLFLTAMVLICLYAYFESDKPEKTVKKAFMLGYVSCCALFCLCETHPQWFNYVLVFILFISIYVDVKKYSFLMIANNIAVALFGFLMYFGGIDTYMVRTSLFSHLAGMYKEKPIVPYAILDIISHSLAEYSNLIAAGLLGCTMLGLLYLFVKSGEAQNLEGSKSMSLLCKLNILTSFLISLGLIGMYVIS